MVSLRHDALSRRRVLLAAGACLMMASPGQASARVILTVILADGTRHDFSDAAIRDLPWQLIETHTAWTEGLQRFRGPRLADVLTEVAGAPFDLAQRRLRMTALNDFVVEIPASDAWTFDPILAREANGDLMRVRDKGPLWLVYPRDARVSLQDPLMDERWIWQLRTIEIL